MAEPDLDIDDCFWYGPSTKNQRIEAWWGQLAGSTNFFWRHCFSELDRMQIFKEANELDVVTLLAVYMPSVRDTIKEYVLTWNQHDICKMNNRPNSISGKPFLNYYYPNYHGGRTTTGDHTTQAYSIHDYRCPVNTEMRDCLYEDVNDWNPEEYLPQDTLAWCTTQMQDLGFDANNPPPRDCPVPYLGIYIHLRLRAIHHTSMGCQPELRLCEKPTGAYDWVERRAESGDNRDETRDGSKGRGYND